MVAIAKTQRVVKYHPILFSAEMIRSLLAGLKSQTRRIINPQPEFDGYWWTHKGYSCNGERGFREGMPLFGKCPYGQVDDRLWVRESCWLRPDLTRRMMRSGADTWPKVIYAADPNCDKAWCKENDWTFRPSIHMPRWTSRITLEITDVRVERAQEISEADAKAEGIEPVVQMGTYTTFKNYMPGLPSHVLATCSFKSLWESINGSKSWNANPWVWVVSFKRVEVPRA